MPDVGSACAYLTIMDDDEELTAAQRLAKVPEEDVPAFRKAAAELGRHRYILPNQQPFISKLLFLHRENRSIDGFDRNNRDKSNVSFEMRVIYARHNKHLELYFLTAEDKQITKEAFQVRSSPFAIRTLTKS